MINLYVIALLVSGDSILLLRRTADRNFGAGLYHLPGGKVEPGERALQALTREIFEELDLIIPESSFDLVHTFHRNTHDKTLIALVFKTDITGFTPINKENNKHDAIQFFTLDTLPDNIIPAHKQAIECIKKNISYSEHGW